MTLTELLTISAQDPRKSPELQQLLLDAAGEIERLGKELAALPCPNAYGFEGAETYLDCGRCAVCVAKLAQQDKKEQG